MDRSADEPLILTGERLPTQLVSDGGLPGPPRSLAVVSGGITQGTLRKRAAELGVPADSYATTTIEGWATTLVAVARGCSAGDIEVMDEVWRRNRVREILTSSPSGPLELVATRHGDDIVAVTHALEEWWRATDAGSAASQRQLSRSIEDISPFHRDTTETLFAAFESITASLERQLDQTTFLSRSHLVRAARDCLDYWSEVHPSIERICIGSISVLDNPTLRFIISAAAHNDLPPIRICAGAGTLARFYQRITAAAATEGIQVPEPEPVEDDETVACLRDLARGDISISSGGIPGHVLNVECVTVPRKRDEATYVMQAASEMEASGNRASDVLGVFPEAGEYLEKVASASRRANIPADVETRFRLAHTPLARAVKATLELLASVQPTIDTVLRPLEYGALPPHTSRDTPLGDADLAAVREEVSTTAGTLGDWADAFEQTSCDAGREVKTFVREIRAHSRRALTGDNVSKLAQTIVDNYPTCARHAYGRYRPHRVALQDKYPSEKTRQDVRQVGQRTGRVISDLASPSWADAAEMLTEALGGAGTGRPQNNAMAARIIDAGNAYFRTAPWVIVGGLATGLFPPTGTGGSLIPESVRTTVADAVEEYPYLYFDSEVAQVARAVDEYVAALRCATDKVTLLRPARDKDGREQAPSRFVADLMSDDVGRNYPLDYHQVGGFINPVSTPDWARMPPASIHDRLSVLGLNRGPALGGHQTNDRTQHDERLVDIAATLDETTAEDLDHAQAQLNTMLERSQPNRPRLPTELESGLTWSGAAGSADANAD